MAEDQKSRLGKGLAALLGDMADEVPLPGKSTDSLRRIALSLITANPRNPRQDFDDEALNELVVSIRQKGVLQPILVRTHPVMPGQYELIAGERRWRAAQKAGLTEVPVLVQDASDQESLELAIIENVQRSDLNPLDEAAAYQQLIKEFVYKQDQVATVVGKSRSYITNMLRLLKLPDSVKAAIQADKISAGHAKMLVGLEDAEALAKQIISEGWSVRDLEAALQRRRATDEDQSDALPRTKQAKNPSLTDLENAIARSVGLKVLIVDKGGKGSHLRIYFDDHEQFSHLMKRLDAH